MRLLLRIVLWIGAATLVLGIAASFHPTVRSVYRAFRPSQSYDTRPPAVPELAEPSILIFTKTNGFRHFEGIEAGVPAIQRIAERRGWSAFHTESGAVFAPEILSRFRVVVWHNASGAPLSGSQRVALRDWIEGGGGFVGIHAALDDSHASWPWYQDEVVGAKFIGHPLPHQEATVRVENREHPATKSLDLTYRHFDEWYSFDRSVRGDEGVEVLASVDESTYDQRLKFLLIDEDLAMGDHPVFWTRPVAQGRAFLSALGHVAGAYSDPNYLAVLEGALEWAGQLRDSDPDGFAGMRQDGG